MENVDQNYNQFCMYRNNLIIVKAEKSQSRAGLNPGPATALISRLVQTIYAASKR